MPAASICCSATVPCPRSGSRPGELRDQRELPRARMMLVRQRSQLKNRIHATRAKYALHDVDVTDLFGVRGRALLRERLVLLPEHTAYTTGRLLEQVEQLTREVDSLEQRMTTVFKPTPAIQWLLTLPGVGLILAVVIALEVGDVTRFPTAEKLAGYAGPRRASPPAAARCAMATSGRTSTGISSGRSSKPPTRSASTADTGRAAMSPDSTSASRAAGATPPPSAPSPGISPKPRTGC